MWSGRSGSNADEWVERYNRSDISIDLIGWTLPQLNDGQDLIMLVFDETSIAPGPGQTFLISNYPANHDKSRLAAQPQLVTTPISLPNNKLLLRLFNGNPHLGETTLIDIADDGGHGSPFAGSDSLKQSMFRIAFDSVGDQSVNWTAAALYSRWDIGATELGTPGSFPPYLPQKNETTGRTGSDTLIEAATWPVLKKVPRISTQSFFLVQCLKPQKDPGDFSRVFLCSFLCFVTE
jgi:hypothetical protein